MIEQQPVQAGDRTTPTITDIRQRIAVAVDGTQGTAFERLKTWLQMPIEPDFVEAVDRRCEARAQDVGTLLSPAGMGPFTPASLASKFGVEDRWITIDKKLVGGQAVAVQGNTGHVGGSRSYFLRKDNAGYHTVVFLAKGTDAGGRDFHLGLDPDASATDASRAKWVQLVPAGTRLQSLSVAESTQLIKAMILGDSPDGFGPLVRKYYVDTKAAFPPIIRG